MKDTQLDSTGDISFENGDIAIVTDDEELEQSVSIIVQTRLGEFEPGPDLGLDPENMFGKSINEEYLATDIADAITEQEPRVASVTSVKISKPDSDRNAELNISYTKVDGTQNTMETGVSLNV